MKSYADEPKDGKPVVGSGPVPAGRGHGRRVDVPVREEPGLLERHAARRRGRLPGLQEQRPGRAGADQGRGRLRRRHHAAAGQGAPGPGRASPPSNGISPLFEEIGFNTGAVDTETGKPMGDGNPALQGPEVPARARLRRGHRRASSRAPSRGPRRRARRSCPTPYTNCHWEPPARRGLHLRPRQGRPAARRGGLQEGRRRQAHDARRQAARARCGSSPAATQKSSVDTMDFFKEWLADLGIDSKVTAMDSSKLGDVILDGEYDAFQWDWYVEPDPDGILADFTCDQRGGLSDSWYCDKAYDAMYKQQNGEMDNAKRVDDRQADAAEALRGLALHRDGVHHDRARPCAATGSPASSRSPTRAVSGWCSTARTTTTQLRPASPRRATATASTSALEAGAASSTSQQRRRRQQQRRADRRRRGRAAAARRRRGAARDAAPDDRGRARVSCR